MTQYHYTSNFKVIADLHPEHLRPFKDMIEIARRKARLPGLAIYGKIEPLHEVCPGWLVGNTFPEKRFIITGAVQLVLARRAGGWNVWSDHTHCETFCMALRRDEKEPGQPGSTRDRRMAKKSKRSKQHQKGLAFPRLLEQQVSRAQQQMLQGDFPGTIDICEPLLTSLPRRSSLRAEVLILLGLAHGMLHHYQESYDLFTEALAIDPTNAEVWYNRGLACRFTTRFGQAVRDFERAVALSRNGTSELARKFVTELEISRKDLQEAMGEHETSITLEQYIEREERFMHAMDLMRQSKWQEGELAFRQVIEKGGGLPQYWGNLGVSLLMQARYEEAEAALRRALEIDPHYTLARTNLEKIPDVRRAGGPLGIELRDLSQVQGIKQSISFSEQDHSGSSPTTHTTIEKAGNALKRTGKPLGKQPPLYRFFLNPYQDARFTTCPQCGLKTGQRKCPLVIHIHSMPTLILGKTCRYCATCDLLIAHQDQVEEQIALYVASSRLEITGNDYLVMGTLDRPEWRKGMQDPLSVQEMVEHLHDFKEVVTFQRAYM